MPINEETIDQTMLDFSVFRICQGCDHLKKKFEVYIVSLEFHPNLI